MTRRAAKLSLRRCTRTSRNEAMLVDRAPKPVEARQRSRPDDFIQMPFVAARRSTLADLVRKMMRPNLCAHWRTVLVAHANLRAPRASPRPCEGSEETGNRAKPRS